jgi:hypothetical protein
VAVPSPLQARIAERVPRIWERRDVVLEWARFLARAGGLTSPVSPTDVGYTSTAEYEADLRDYEEWDAIMGRDRSPKAHPAVEVGAIEAGGTPAMPPPAADGPGGNGAQVAPPLPPTPSVDGVGTGRAGVGRDPDFPSDRLHRESASAPAGEAVQARLLEYAARLFALGELDAAVAVWEAVLDERPDDARLLNDVGEGGLMVLL